MENNKKQCIIYKTTNLINNKIYVGQDINNNPNYYGKGTIITLAIKKYGKDNFKKEILEYCSFDQLDDKEIFWIKKLKSQDRNIGYNILDGGQNRKNMKLPETTKRKISLSLKKYYIKNPEVCKDISKRAKFNNAGIKNPMFGKGYKLEGDKNGMYGKTHTDEVKEKISKANKGRKHKKETIENYKINRVGDKNGMYGKNQYSIWIEKYGKQIADDKYNTWKLNLSKVGKKCINNGKISKYVKIEEINDYITQGWELGMKKRKKKK